MKQYIVRKTQRSSSLLRERSVPSQEGIRMSSVSSRVSDHSELRSLKETKGKTYTRSLARTQAMPYQVFVRELKIKLPTPKQKFYEFLRIPPFNRVQSQNEMISLFIKNMRFFKLHQPSLITNMSRKVKMIEMNEIDSKMMLILLEGECRYRGDKYSAGQLLNRQPIQAHQIQELQPSSLKLLALNRHEYLSFLFSFINQEMVVFKDFIHSIQTFKMFTEKTLQKFTDNMTLHYYLKGEKLYRLWEEATTLFVVFSGQVSRKVTIQIQYPNKIPPYAKKDKYGFLRYEKSKRDVRILTKEYEHRIAFKREDIIGLTEIIDKVHVRKQEIDVDEDTILLGIDRSILQESLDDYILDHLKKYNLKKFPSSYEQFCDNYKKEKESTRKMEERKIVAMQNELKLHHSDRRREKIESIIRLYESNIKNIEKVNLKNHRIKVEVE